MGIEQFESPVSQRRYIWFAKYYDNSILTEFEPGGKENEFKDIDKENIKEFGIIGENSKIWFDTGDGIIQLINPSSIINTFDFNIEDDKQQLIRITNRNFHYNDIIEYHKVHRDYDPRTKEQCDMVHDGLHFGYKMEVDVPDKGKLYFQVLFKLNFGEPCQIDFKITPTFDFVGFLTMRFNRNAIPPTSFETKANKSITLSKRLVGREQ